VGHEDGPDDDTEAALKEPFVSRKVMTTALEYMLRRWNEVADHVAKTYPVEEFPRAAVWVKHERFPEITALRSRIRNWIRRAMKEGRSFAEEFEWALFGVQHMKFWTEDGDSWKPNLESFFVMKSWDTKVSAGKQAMATERARAEKERLENEAVEKEFDRIHAERLSKLNGQVTA
jgi:hypothetical protein